MSKFKVMIVKKDGKPIAVRAAQVNGRVVNLALREERPCSWHKAVKKGIPSIADWVAIYENKDAVNKDLKRAGGEPLQDGWYWSSTECSSCIARILSMSSGSVYYDYKSYAKFYVRCVVAC